MCFVVGLVIGLPALRIKGLYLALVTLSVATLFPLLVDQFASLHRRQLAASTSPARS